MAKKFMNLDKNVNNSSSLDDITTFTTSDNKKVKSDNKLEYKNFPLKLPVEYHSRLKFKLAEKYDKSMNELIIDALEKAYPELCN